MEFKKYNSIENSFQEKFIRQIHERGFGDMEYIVQEKVHGANLSFITDGREVLTAKRTEVLPENDAFYNVKPVREKYHDAILSLFEELSEVSGASSVTVFGELFGGIYPHPDVPAVKNAKTVQKGVFYAPFNDFFAFDILVDDTYLDPVLAELLLARFGFTHATTLFKGSLEECLAYPNEFHTTIPLLYGLPEIEGNTCEGVVIKPVKAAFMPSGSRVILKNKNDRFSEKKNKGDKPVDGIQPGKEATELCREISGLITGNRLNNVISKVGEVTPKDFGKLLGMYSKDIHEDFLKEHRSAFEKLEKPEMKAINKFVSSEARKMLLSHFGEY